MIGGLWKSTSSLAMFAAAGLFVGGVAMPSAKAADLGGDCCADLEERVAELEATTARKGNRRVSLTISGQVTTNVMYWNDGGAKFRAVGNKDNKVNGVDIVAGGSNASDTYIVDTATAGGTLVSFAGSARINPNLSAGFNVTMAYCGGARSHQVNQNDDDAPQATCFVGGGAASDPRGGDSTFVTTLANWYIDHNQLGRLTVGRINTSTAGITTVDLGGAGVIANASIGYTQRGFLLIDDGGNLRTTAWNALLGGGTVNGASLSRANAIQYNSPTVGGFSVSGSWGENDLWDVALRYAGEMGGFRLAAGIGYVHNTNGLNDASSDGGTTVGNCNNGTTTGIHCQPDAWKGSASVMHVASGLYLTGAFVRQDNDIANIDDTTLYYVNGGIAKNWIGAGNTVLYGEYARVNHGLQGGLSGSKFLPFTDSRADMWGFGVVQHIDAAAMELYLSFKRYSGELENVPGGGFGSNSLGVQDFDVVTGGARIRF
jgi:hypothetical protein